MTADELRALLNYDPETGIFTWRSSRGRMLPNTVAGCIQSNGYVYIRVMRKSYLAHRLAWFFMVGDWPGDQIDHLNMLRTDNRWANLRAADKNINEQNKLRAQSDSRTGLLGASPHYGLFRASITYGGKSHFLGVFKTPEQAHAAYVTAKRLHHPGGML